MATNKVITVITPSVGTGDTVASYNAYSDQDGSLGSLSVAEAAAGKTFSLSDGVVHSVTVKPVGTSSGEYNAPSNAVTVDLSGGGGWIAPVTSYSYDSIPKDISGLAPAGETVGAYSLAVNQAQTKMWILWRSTKQVTEHALTGTIDVTSVTTPITTSAAWSLGTPMDLSVLDSDDCFYIADYGLNKIVAVPMPTANDLSSVVGSPIPTTTNFFTVTQPRSAMVKAIGASDYLYYTVSADKTIRKRLITDPKDLTTVAGTDAETLDTSAVVTAGQIHSIKFSTDGLNMYFLQTAPGLSKVHRYLLSGDGTLTGATFQESVTFTESNEHRGMFIDGEQLILGSSGTGVTDTLYNYVGA